MGALRRMFGPSKAEVWAQLAGETGATFVEGGFFGKDKVVARVRDWTVTLDTVVVSAGKTTVIYTRMRAPYVNPDGFRFDVYRKSVFSGLGRLLGIQDVAVGVPDIDEEFVIKGGDESRLRALFADPKLCELIRAQPEFHLQVKDDEGWFGTHFPEGVDELHFQVLGVIKDIPRLRALFDLFAEVLDRLCLIGSAYEGDPGVTL